MKQFILLFFVLFVTNLFTQEIHQKAKIIYTNHNDLTKLNDLGIPIDHGIHKRGVFIISEFSISEIEKVRNAGFQVEILIENSKEHFLTQNRLNKSSKRNEFCDDNASETYQTPANFSLGSMGGYYTYQEMLNQLDLMKALYPNLITTKQNISTFLTEGEPDSSTSPPIGGNGIKWVKISDNPNSSSEEEPQILYTSIHHAREPLTLSQLIFYMWYLLENYDSSDEVKGIVDNTELYFVPVVNPDGYLYNEKTDPNGGGFWRKNRKNGNGVDNNRNYDYYINGNPNNNVWSGPGSSSSPESQTYHGTAPFSEVENQAMRWFVENHNFLMAFNNHSSGRLLYYPHAYDDVVTVEDELFSAVATELVSRSGYFPLRDSPFSGESDDFMYGTVGTHNKIYSFTPEIGTSFWMPSDQIESVCKEMMYQNITSVKMINNFATIKESSSTFVGNQSVINNIFSVKRFGIFGDGNFTISINPISANIISVENPITLNNIALFEEVESSISYTLATDTTAGDDITFEYVVNNGQYDSKILVNKKFGALNPIFENDGSNVTQDFITDAWDVTSDSFVSSPTSITDSPFGDYENNTNSTITLIENADLTDAIGANISFYAKWNIEGNWDYLQFEISTDNGNSWIPQCGKFTSDGNNFGVHPEGEPLYTGVQNDWILEEIDLSDYLGESILFRFHIITDGFITGDGFYFDDLKINILEQTELATNNNEIKTFNIYPNPVNDILNITTLSDNYQIEVYSIQGRLINRTSKNSGSKIFDYSGFESGIYILKISSETNSEVFKIIKK
jgi:hypothetical protein